MGKRQTFKSTYIMKKISRLIIKNLNIITLVILFITSKTYCQSDLKIQIDSLSKYAKPEFKLIDFEINNDTLKIVSTSDFLYYPFGKFYSPENVIKVLPQLTTMERNIKNKDIYKFIFKTSYVKTFLTEGICIGCKKNIEIVYAEIKDKEIVLKNGINLGISKKEFMNKFFDQNPVDFSEINVIELVSGLDGIWQYYDFKENNLVKIHFDTDYTIDKK